MPSRCGATYTSLARIEDSVCLMLASARASGDTRGSEGRDAFRETQRNEDDDDRVAAATAADDDDVAQWAINILCVSAARRIQRPQSVGTSLMR